jgi:hypothetical protein
LDSFERETPKVSSPSILKRFGFEVLVEVLEELVVELDVLEEELVVELEVLEELIVELELVDGAGVAGVAVPAKEAIAPRPCLEVISRTAVACGQSSLSPRTTRYHPHGIEREISITGTASLSFI